MEAKLEALQASQLLRKLEEVYNVREVKYDIINYQFSYIQANEEKTISLQTLTQHQFDEGPKSEVLLELAEVSRDYIPEYINRRISEFYIENGMEVPASIFIFKGLLQCFDREGDEYYIPFKGSSGQILDQFSKILN